MRGFDLACLLPLVAIFACSEVSESAQSPSSEDDVTAIPAGHLRDQRETGNCWLYATAAWIENLEYQALIEKGKASATNPSSRPPQISVSYFDYWDWYDKITSGEITSQNITSDDLDSGGSWGWGVELVLKHGIVRSKDFGTVSIAADADLTTRAVKAMVASLTTGALTTKTARHDTALVKRELDVAFNVQMSSLTSAVVRAHDLDVIVPHADGTREVRTLEDVIGKAHSTEDPDRRTGPYAWSDVTFNAKTPTETRAFFARMQRALNANVPLPAGWFYPDNADPNGTGQFRAVPTGIATDEDSVEHETLLTDYEVDDVPGFGRLGAGEPATDAQKEAALDSGAKVVFFRTQDSYGVLDGRTKKKTSDDLYVTYLLGKSRVCPKGVSTSSKCHTYTPLLIDVTFPAGF